MWTALCLHLKTLIKVSEFTDIPPTTPVLEFTPKCWSINLTVLCILCLVWQIIYSGKVFEPACPINPPPTRFPPFTISWFSVVGFDLLFYSLVGMFFTYMIVTSFLAPNFNTTELTFPFWLSADMTFHIIITIYLHVTHTTYISIYNLRSLIIFIMSFYMFIQRFFTTEYPFTDSTLVYMIFIDMLY